MSKFESIRIQGFRRLIDVKLELRPLTVMIGANGCGKTSLLEAWRLLARSAEGKLREERDLEQFVTKAGPNIDPHQRIRFEVRVVNQAVQLDYTLRIMSRYNFEEKLTETDSDGLSKESLPEKYANSSTSRIQETKLYDAALDPTIDHHREIRRFQQTLASCEMYRPIPIATLRNWQPSLSADSPGLQAETLFSYLKTVAEKDTDRFEIIEDTLRSAFPQYERLEFREVIPGRLAMSWKDGHFNDPIYMTQLSDGTLRFLWLISLLLRHEIPAFTSNLPPVTLGLPEVMLIDEPELSLHPQLLMLLVDLMREASLRTQLIVATQSDQLVRFLKPEEVLVADVEDGAARFTWGDDLDLDHWLKDFTLDQLWTMGVLGGRS